MRSFRSIFFIVLGLCAGAGLPSIGVASPRAAESSASPSTVDHVDHHGMPRDAKGLMEAMARLEGLQARFTETKTLALLKAPLVSRGILYYTQPGYLVRRVESPSPSTVRIGPERLELHDATGQQQFDLRARPDIKTFVESFVHVMAGNHEALSSVYTLAFQPASTPEDPWILTLVPRSAPLTELVTRLEVSGRGYRVSTIRVLERRGDRTEIEITEVDPARTFTPQERQSIFGLPKPK